MRCARYSVELWSYGASYHLTYPPYCLPQACDFISVLVSLPYKVAVVNVLLVCRTIWNSDWLAVIVVVFLYLGFSTMWLSIILQLKTCLGASSRGTTLDITYGHWRNEPGNTGGNQPLTSDTWTLAAPVRLWDRIVYMQLWAHLKVWRKSNKIKAGAVSTTCRCKTVAKHCQGNSEFAKQTTGSQFTPFCI